MTAAPENGRLHVLKAVEDGWNAFAKAPWTFLLYQALVVVIALCFAFLATISGLRLASFEGLSEIHPAGATLGLIIGLIGYVITMLWGGIGIIRGAWISLEGQKPTFRTFTRWDGNATRRLFIKGVSLIAVILIIAIITSVAGLGLAQINSVLAIAPAAVFFIIYVYLIINQKFLPFIALFEKKTPFEAIARGRKVVDPSWWMVAWFFIVEAVLYAIAGLFQYGGLFVVFPVLTCISTAAYRQLFGKEDQTGLLSGN